MAREVRVVRMAKLVRVACAEGGGGRLMLGRRDQDGEGGQSDEGDQGSQ